MPNKKNKQKKSNSEPDIKPDPETLHRTDPQEHMEGPVSSLVNATKEIIEEKGSKTHETTNKQ